MLTIQARAQLGLDGAKMNAPLLISRQDELHGSITQMTNAIKEE